MIYCGKSASEKCKVFRCFRINVVFFIGEVK